MELLSHKTEPVGDESLEKWKLVGSGGFGRVYKVRHKDWGFDMAIKILHDGVCSHLPHSSPLMPKEKALYEEANHMEKASCEFVLRLYGIYQGPSKQHGIVMEFMERGSVQSLLNYLSAPPPWPLAFRLAHQVALGMNFLHKNNLMHHDLKPSNVLLNDDLNAKLADFGLSRVSNSALNSNREATGQIGGSYKYMPPEAFEASYQPVRSFDIYSYGILLWSIVTGKEPYQAADYNLVALRIPLGDRPSCEEVDQMKAEGLKELVDLMQRCWDNMPSKRPTIKECLEVTENVLSKHKKGIHDAVYQVLTRLVELESPTSNQHSDTSVAFNCLQTPEQSESNDIVDHVRFTQTERSSIQDSVNVSTKVMSDTAKALSPFALQKIHTPLRHGNPPRGKCVQVSSRPTLLFLRTSASHHPTHPSHPTPSCINAPNPLCGRVTSATVRNRVKLSRHRKNGGERSSTDNQAALRSRPPVGRISAT
ncbi:ankyrin repeat and protein kinase domain-containing protein 1-like isoform X3 [Siniperca chuatsi]|nr:ankyrin repeat and protein kinase domain-containing protein 1-like isoform X3 [Siniperca chuatsi]XP_044050734.1 ankyrin repeat and protein kinase domain-containing protein 1-like isoform X3 [Siniperca chuatsi]XP_044050735.1 ankyrin repeat and protein kinase domain-containing protein 1-like isoform X3 [Siniperca chuatsi]